MEIYESIWSKKIGHRLAQITQIEKYKFEDEAPLYWERGRPRPH